MSNIIEALGQLFKTKGKGKRSLPSAFLMDDAEEIRPKPLTPDTALNAPQSVLERNPETAENQQQAPQMPAPVPLQENYEGKLFNTDLNASLARYGNNSAPGEAETVQRMDALPVNSEPVPHPEALPLMTDDRNAPEIKMPPPKPGSIKGESLYDEINRRENKNWKVKQRDGGDGDNDHNWWDAVKSGMLYMGRGLSQTGDLTAGLTAGAAGLVKGAIDPNTDEKFFNDQRLQQIRPQYDEQFKREQERESADLGREYKQAQIDEIRRRPEKELNSVRAKVELETLKFSNRMKQIREEQSFKAGEYDLVTDGEGKVWKVFKKDPNRPKEPSINPETRMQDVDPSKVMYETYSPMTRTMVQIKGSDLYSGESMVASQNAGRTQQASTFNSQQEQEWNNTITKNREKRGEIESKIAAADSKRKLLIAANDAKRQEIAQLNPGDEAQAKRIEQLQKEIEKNDADWREATASLESLGKEKGGIVDPPKPVMVAPQTVSIGQVSEDEFKARLVKNGITDPAKQKALIDIARQDKVIK